MQQFCPNTSSTPTFIMIKGNEKAPPDAAVYRAYYSLKKNQTLDQKLGGDGYARTSSISFPLLSACFRSLPLPFNCDCDCDCKIYLAYFLLHLLISCFTFFALLFSSFLFSSFLFSSLLSSSFLVFFLWYFRIRGVDANLIGEEAAEKNRLAASKENSLSRWEGDIPSLRWRKRMWRWRRRGRKYIQRSNQIKKEEKKSREK